MTENTHALADRLRKAYQQLDRFSSLARQIHKAAQPGTFPTIPPVAIGLAGRSRATLCDAWPLGNERISAALIVTSGAGGLAELLGLLVKQHLILTDLHTGGEVPPGAVLGQVNTLLLGLGFPDPPLVSLGLVRMSRKSPTIEYARAAVPAFVHMTRSGSLSRWSVPGPFLGIQDATFASGTGEWQPDDKLVLSNREVTIHEASDHELPAQRCAEALSSAETTAFVLERLP